MNRKKTKIYIICNIVLIFLLIVLFMAFNKELQDKNKNLEEKNKKLLIEIEKIKNNLSDDLPNSNIKKCKFVQTYRILHILNDYVVDPDYIFVVADQYQNFFPTILRIPIEYKESLVIDNFYEFSFTGDSSMKKNDFTIINIVETDKIGMNQIQETCK